MPALVVGWWFHTGRFSVKRRHGLAVFVVTFVLRGFFFFFKFGIEIILELEPVAVAYFLSSRLDTT